MSDVPHLRFPEFSGEWEKYSNNTLFKIISERNKNHKYSTILSASQTDGMVLRDSLGIDIKYESDSIKTYKIVKAGDYVVHLRSFQGGFAFSDKVGVCSPAYTILRPSELISYGFLKSYFMSKRFIDSLRLVTYGIRDGKSISIEEWMDLYTSLPKTDEQKKISKLLRLIDEHIATQNKVIEKLETLIKGIADSIFKTAKAHKTISELSSTVTTGKDKAGIGNVPLYGSTGIIGKTERASNSGNIVLVARVGSIGTIQFVDEPCGVSDNTLIIDAGINTKFIYFFLCTYDFSSITSGTTQPLITATSLKKVKIPIFCPELQNHIVCMLSSFSDIISTERAMLEQYVTQKQYLLRQMFI